MTELAQSCGSFATALSAFVIGVLEEHLVGSHCVRCVVLKQRLNFIYLKYVKVGMLFNRKIILLASGSCSMYVSWFNNK